MSRVFPGAAGHISRRSREMSALQQLLACIRDLHPDTSRVGAMGPSDFKRANRIFKDRFLHYTKPGFGHGSYATGEAKAAVLDAARAEAGSEEDLRFAICESFPSVDIDGARHWFMCNQTAVWPWDGAYGKKRSRSLFVKWMRRMRQDQSFDAVKGEKPRVVSVHSILQSKEASAYLLEVAIGAHGNFRAFGGGKVHVFSRNMAEPFLAVDVGHIDASIAGQSRSKEGARTVRMVNADKDRMVLAHAVFERLLGSWSHVVAAGMPNTIDAAEPFVLHREDVDVDVARDVARLLVAA